MSQIPVTIFSQSTPVGVFTWNGTGGKWTAQRKRVLLMSKYTTARLYFGESGVKLQKMKFIFEKDIKDIANIDDYMK